MAAITFGTAHIVTVEYNVSNDIVTASSSAINAFFQRLHYDHPNITTVLPSELEEYVVAHGAFDVAISISSFEHDGLGRYGDPLRPLGDMNTMSSVNGDLRLDGVCTLAGTHPRTLCRKLRNDGSCDRVCRRKLLCTMPLRKQRGSCASSKGPVLNIIHSNSSA